MSPFSVGPLNKHGIIVLDCSCRQIHVVLPAIDMYPKTAAIGTLSHSIQEEFYLDPTKPPCPTRWEPNGWLKVTAVLGAATILRRPVLEPIRDPPVQSGHVTLDQGPLVVKTPLLEGETLFAQWRGGRESLASKDQMSNLSLWPDNNSTVAQFGWHSEVCSCSA